MKAIIKIIFSIILLSIPAQVLGSSYRELREEYERNEPPAYYTNIQSSAKPIKQEPEPTNNQLILKQEELEKLKNRWDNLITTVSMDKTFFNFDSEQSQKIRKVAATEPIKAVLEKELALEVIIPAAFERNPELQRAKKEWAATLERYSQATTLDTIMRQYNTFIKGLNTKTSSQPHKQMVSQQFPFPGTLGLKGDIISKEVEIARENYHIELRDLITQIKLAYYELAYVNEVIQITNKNLKLLKHLESTAFIRYKTGRAGYSAVIKIQTRLSKLKNDLITLEEKRRTVCAKLNQSLDLPSGFALGQPKATQLQDTNLSLGELTKLGLEQQQEIKRLKLEIERTNLAIELAEKKFYPDFTLGTSYFEDRAKNLAGVAKQKKSFSIKPAKTNNVWFGKNEAYIREARLKYQATHNELSALKNNLRYRVKEELFKRDTAKRDALLYRDSLLKLAQNSLQVSETEYLAGKIDFLNVLDAQTVWLDYNLIYHRALRDQNQSIARLEQIIGQALEKEK